jgi:DNA-binding transcriptional ArsR family regulator
VEMLTRPTIMSSAMRNLPHPNPEDLKPADIFHALGDPIRIEIVKCLFSKGEQTCGNVAVPVSKSTASHHFRILREAGIIRMKASGPSYLNSLRRDELDARFPGLIDLIISIT